MIDQEPDDPTGAQADEENPDLPLLNCPRQRIL
jgi:hypothetical protein